MSMAWSLESRVPFLDRRIVELVASMPPRIKYAGGQSKFVLKTAFEAELPQEVLGRKDKMGFPVPLHLWRRRGLRDEINGFLSDRRTVERGIFRKEFLERVQSRNEPYDRRLWGGLRLRTGGTTRAQRADRESPSQGAPRCRAGAAGASGQVGTLPRRPRPLGEAAAGAGDAGRSIWLTAGTRPVQASATRSSRFSNWASAANGLVGNRSTSSARTSAPSSRWPSR